MNASYYATTGINNHRETCQGKICASVMKVLVAARVETHVVANHVAEKVLGTKSGGV